jgi:hypothetical protein
VDAILFDLIRAFINDPLDEACRLALSDRYEELGGSDPTDNPDACMAQILRDSGPPILIHAVRGSTYVRFKNGSFGSLLPPDEDGVSAIYPKLWWTPAGWKLVYET